MQKFTGILCVFINCHERIHPLLYTIVLGSPLSLILYLFFSLVLCTNVKKVAKLVLVSFNVLYVPSNTAVSVAY